jgi:hypothetical protein
MSESKGYNEKLKKLIKAFVSGKREGSYANHRISSGCFDLNQPWHVTELYQGDELLARREQGAKRITISEFIPASLKDLVLAYRPEGWRCVSVSDMSDPPWGPIEIQDIGEHEIVVHIPRLKHEDENIKISREECERINKIVNDRMKRFFEDLGGGCTWFGFGGSWRCQGKEHIDEGHHYWCILDKDLYNNDSEFKHSFEDLLDGIGYMLRQESIYVEIDGKAKLLYVRSREVLDEIGEQCRDPGLLQ